jgi:hypothetical protein
MHKWGFGESPDCVCGAEQQTMDHIVNKCPLRLFPCGLLSLNEANPDAVEYLSRLDPNTRPPGSELRQHDAFLMHIR